MNYPAALILVVALAAAPGAFAQETEQDPATRADLIEQAQTEKAASLTPAHVDKIEAYVSRLSTVFLGGGMKWHAYFRSPYSGGGLVLGAGYLKFVSPKNTLDVRGSFTFSGYKKIEAEFIAPELFNRRGTLDAIGGWREATQVGFYGFGISTAQDARANYGFQQPYASATLDVRPMRNLLVLRGGLEVSQWNQGEGSGSAPSIETIYTTETLPGLGTSPVYLHSQATVGIDSRTGPGYSRVGGFYGVTFHDYADKDSAQGFQQIDYEAIQHIPLVREAWVISLHGMLSTAWSKSGQQIPFFMTPALGGGSDLRAYSSWRFRDLNTLLLQAEWRVMVNRFLDMAVFYDTGRVASRLDALKLNDLKSDVGLGFRFHGPTMTPLRIDFTTGSEGFGIVFAASPVF